MVTFFGPALPSGSFVYLKQVHWHSVTWMIWSNISPLTWIDEQIEMRKNRLYLTETWRERKNTMTAALVTLFCKSISYPKIRHLSSATGFAGFSVLTVVWRIAQWLLVVLSFYPCVNVSNLLNSCWLWGNTTRQVRLKACSSIVQEC